MKANDVLKIVFVLNEKEQIKLLLMLQKHLNDNVIVHKSKLPLITKQQADKYIFEYVFNKHK